MKKPNQLQLVGKDSLIRRQLAKISLTMKLTFIMFVLSVNVVWASNSYAQTTVLSLDVKNKSVANVLDEIEKQSEFRFYYNSKLVDTQRKVSFNVEKEDVFSILDQIFASTNVGYKVVDKDVILTERDKNSPVNQQAAMQQQGIKITGTISDEAGQSIIGANVIVKGTPAGTVTDIEGQFSIVVPDEKAVLMISFVGFTSQEVAVGNRNNIDIILKEDLKLLNEVVVIGYGTVKKSNLSGAVSNVTAKDLTRLPSANLSQALQGNAPGLHAVQTNREPGAEVTLTIRGSNSFTGGQPLYIVDGFPMGSSGGIQAINPNDIESVSVLKDASSVAIYGARAANGVILITTKSGKEGAVSLDVDAYFGMKYFSNPVKTMNAEQFAQLRRESFLMDGIEMPSTAFLQTELNQLSQGRSTNWWDEVTRQGSITQSYQVSYNSGTETTKMFVGAGFFDEEGIVNNSGFVRGNLRFNGSQKIGKRVTISSYNNISLLSQKGSEAESVLFPSVVGNPMSPVVDENGKYYVMIQNALGTPRLNPVTFTQLPVNNVIQPVINLSLALDVKLVEGLNLKTQLSGAIDSWRQNLYYPKSISGSAQGSVQGKDGFASITSNVNYNWISETLLSYNKTFGKRHNIDALAGFSAQKNRYETLTAAATGFASDTYETYNLSAGSGEPRKPSSGLTEWSMLSYIGRAIYTLDDKYILTANMRIDGSSRFSEGEKWGIFPSAAAAWKLSEESFLKDVDWFSNLKLRGSYGLAGNAMAISPYQTLPVLSYASFNFDGKEAPGYYEQNMRSSGIKWESTYQMDLGLDVSFFDRRLNLTLDYYSKITKDLIRQVNLPAVSGFPNTYINMGDLQNRGVELAINSVNFDNEFRWLTTFLFSSNKNKLISLGNGEDKIGTTHWVGKPIFIGNRYMIQADGIWQQSEEVDAKKYGSVPGDVRYVDQNKDGKINEEDRVFIGNLYPNFYGSMVNEFSYKKFDLNFLLSFEQGRDIYNGNNYVLLSGQGADNNRIEMLDRWTPTNPSNKYPRASSSAKNRLSSQTSEFLEDASYIKIRNITMGYTLPGSAVKKIGIKNLRLYFSVINPFTFTKYSGMDPEDSDIGNTERASSYPITTNYMFGIQMKL